GELQGVLGSHFTLSKIDKFLKEVEKDKNAIAIIVEKESGELIANSFDMKNHNTLKDGSIERYNISKMNNEAIVQAVGDYNGRDENYYIKRDGLHINVTEFYRPGMNWLVITAVPDSLFIP